MKKRHREFKLLILGSELSGKTTFFKQMQLSHGTNPSISDRKSYSLSIIRAIFLGIQRLIKVVQRHQIGKKFFVICDVTCILGYDSKLCCSNEYFPRS